MIDAVDRLERTGARLLGLEADLRPPVIAPGPVLDATHPWSRLARLVDLALGDAGPDEDTDAIAVARTRSPAAHVALAPIWSPAGQVGRTASPGSDPRLPSWPQAWRDGSRADAEARGDAADGSPGTRPPDAPTATGPRLDRARPNGYAPDRRRPHDSASGPGLGPGPGSGIPGPASDAAGHSDALPPGAAPRVPPGPIAPGPTPDLSPRPGYAPETPLRLELAPDTIALAAALTAQLRTTPRPRPGLTPDLASNLGPATGPAADIGISPPTAAPTPAPTAGPPSAPGSPAPLTPSERIPDDLMDQLTAELEFEFLRRYGRSGGGR
jgi:hypothetical protein